MAIFSRNLDFFLLIFSDQTSTTFLTDHSASSLPDQHPSTASLTTHFLAICTAMIRRDPRVLLEDDDLLNLCFCSIEKMVPKLMAASFDCLGNVNNPKFLDFVLISDIRPIFKKKKKTGKEVSARNFLFLLYLQFFGFPPKNDRRNLAASMICKISS